MNESIYVVFNPEGSLPKKKHPNVEEATAEAKRLAEANPGQQFIVMRAICSIQYRTDPFQITQYARR